MLSLVKSLQLLDDDSEMIGKLHEDSMYIDCQLAPASRKGSGHSYLDLTGPIPADEVSEVIGMTIPLIDFNSVC